ncbi:MAG: hypothetical protein LBF97_05600 [Elusimicrobiota bacterium]|jgi:hypothetical protein|nr:hypothetical protein [Elusimicrobiota bacterium]
MIEVLTEALKPLNEYKKQFDERTWSEFGDHLIAARAAGLSLPPNKSTYKDVKERFADKTADQVEDETFQRSNKQKEKKETDITWDVLKKKIPPFPIKGSFSKDEEYRAALQKYKEAYEQAKRAYGLIKGKIKPPEVPNKDSFGTDRIAYRHAMEKYMSDKAKYDEDVKRYTGAKKSASPTKVLGKEIKQKIFNVQSEFANLAQELTSSTSVNKVGRLEQIKNVGTYFDSNLNAGRLVEAAKKYYLDAMEVLNSDEINSYFGAIGRTNIINDIKAKFNAVNDVLKTNEEKVKGSKGTKTVAGTQIGRALVLASKEFYKLISELKIEKAREQKTDTTEEYVTRLNKLLGEKDRLQYDITRAIDERTKKVERNLTDEELEKERKRITRKYEKVSEEYESLVKMIELLNDGKTEDYNEIYKDLTSNNVEEKDGQERELDRLKRMSRYTIGQMEKLQADLENVNKKTYDEVSLSDEEKDELKADAKEKVRQLEIKIKDLNARPIVLGHLARSAQGAMRHAKESIYANTNNEGDNSKEKDIGIRGKEIKAEAGSFLHSVNKMRNLDTTSALSLEPLINTIKEIFADAGIIKGSRRNSEGELIEPDGGERIPREPTSEDFNFNIKETQARLAKNKHLTDEEKKKYIRELFVDSKDSLDDFKKLFDFYEKVNKEVEVFKFRKQYSDAKIKENVTNTELQKYTSWVDDNQKEIKEVKKIIMNIQNSGLSVLSALARGVRNPEFLSKEKINDRVNVYDTEQSALSNNEKVNKAFSHIKDSMEKIKENKKLYEPIKYNYQNFKGVLLAALSWAHKRNLEIKYGKMTRRFGTSDGKERDMYPLWINGKVYFIDKSIWLGGESSIQARIKKYSLDEARKAIKKPSRGNFQSDKEFKKALEEYNEDIKNKTEKEFKTYLKTDYDIIETIRQAHKDANSNIYFTDEEDEDTDKAIKDIHDVDKEEKEKEERKKKENLDIANELESGAKEKPKQTQAAPARPINKEKESKKEDKSSSEVSDELRNALKSKEEEEKKKRKENLDIADDLLNAAK